MRECECVYTGDSTIRAKPCSPDAFSLFYYEHFFFIFIYILYTDVFFVYYFRDTPFSLFLRSLFFLLLLARVRPPVRRTHYIPTHVGITLSGRTYKTYPYIVPYSTANGFRRFPKEASDGFHRPRKMSACII